MDIDKLIRIPVDSLCTMGFGSLMDIDKLILVGDCAVLPARFGSLMDIDKLIQRPEDCR